jgi:predicted nucleic acid-binding protein
MNEFEKNTNQTNEAIRRVKDAIGQRSIIVRFCDPEDAAPMALAVAIEAAIKTHDKLHSEKKLQPV